MNSYNLSAYGLESLGMNAVVQNSYDSRQMGPAYAGDCPTGGILACDPIKAASIPVGSPVPVPPDGQGLAQLGNQVYKDTVSAMPITAFDLQCCPNPALCEDQVAWRSSWKGCPPTFFADDPALQCEVAPLGSRYDIGDLNPLKFERSLMQQAEQNPYDYMQARQMWIQFLMKDWIQTKDPYTRPIPNFQASYGAQLKVRGPPAYTTF